VGHKHDRREQLKTIGVKNFAEVLMIYKMDSPVDCFLFIEVESEKMPSIFEKYSLKPI